VALAASYILILRIGALTSNGGGSASWFFWDDVTCSPSEFKVQTKRMRAADAWRSPGQLSLASTLVAGQAATLPTLRRASIDGRILGSIHGPAKEWGWKKQIVCVLKSEGLVSSSAI
jgi:hypothetical protein